MLIIKFKGRTGSKKHVIKKCLRKGLVSTYEYLGLTMTTFENKRTTTQIFFSVKSVLIK